MALTYLLLFLSIVLPKEQEEYPVTWHIKAEKTSSKAFEVQFEAYMDEGWVIYGIESSADGPVATSFSFEPKSDIKLEGAISELTKPELKFEPLFDTEVLKFSKKAIFSQKVTQLGSSKVVKGNINYMACDGTKCLPPTDVPFVALLK